MLTSNSPANLKIVGAEGHSPESIRQAIDHGGKFVIFSYNFSLILVSFRRSSNIYFIPPGQSAVLKSLPFTLVSLVFGWWGIPWGIVYTFQSLYQNIGGGTDVTEAMLASLAPRPLGARVEPPPVRAAPSARTPVSLLRLASVAAVILVLGGVVYAAVSAYLGSNLRVAIVSGTATPYSVVVNGTTYEVSASAPVLVTLSEGEFTVAGGPRQSSDQHFTAETPFLSRPFDRHVLVINPDRLAVVYRETTRYRPTGSINRPVEENAIELLLNQSSYFVPDTDYFFEEFPRTLSMPSDSEVLAKTRIAAVPKMTAAAGIELIATRSSYEQLKAYLTSLAEFDPNSEIVQSSIFTQLKPDDARQVFESQLNKRPLLVEWHRAYQHLMQHKFADVDIETSYRQMAEKDPDDGALLYLYARLLVDRKASHPLYEKALQLKKPTPYASYALAVDAFADAQFADSLALLKKSKEGGMVSITLDLRIRETLVALGRMSEVLGDAKARRAQSPMDTGLFADELVLSQSLKPDRVEGMRAIATFIASLRERYADSDMTSTEQYLGSRLAYALGDEKESSVLGAKLPGSYHQFETAVCRRDHQAAALAVAEQAEIPMRYRWLLMLTAHTAGDVTAAEGYFQQALNSLDKADASSRALAAQIRGGLEQDHVAILRTVEYGEELRVLYTALGVRFPQKRAAYFDRAEKLDREARFPHLLLRSARMAANSTAAPL